MWMGYIVCFLSVHMNRKYIGCIHSYKVIDKLWYLLEHIYAPFKCVFILHKFWVDLLSCAGLGKFVLDWSIPSMMMVKCFVGSSLALWR